MLVLAACVLTATAFSQLARVSRQRVESVVSTLLSRGMKKLGARTRTELVALLAAAR